MLQNNYSAKVFVYRKYYTNGTKNELFYLRVTHACMLTAQVKNVSIVQSENFKCTSNVQTLM